MRQPFGHSSHQKKFAVTTQLIVETWLPWLRMALEICEPEESKMEMPRPRHPSKAVAVEQSL